MNEPPQAGDPAQIEIAATDPFAKPEVRARVAAGFDRLAGVYDVLGRIAFGGALAREARLAAIELSGCEEVLIVGAGTGRVIVDLFAAGFSGRVVSVDLSGGMTRRARRRVEVADIVPVGAVRHVVGTLDDVPAGRRFDGVLTPFVLDVYPDAALGAWCASLVRRCAPEATWIDVDFAHAPPGSSRAALLRGLYGFFRWSCSIPASDLPRVGEPASRAGWVEEGEVARGRFRRCRFRLGIAATQRDAEAT